MVRRYFMQVGLALGLAGACFDPNTYDNCPTGFEGCSCTSGGACDAGLMCLSDVCVAADTGGDGNGDGDGDGEPTGDGDGDGGSTGDGDGDGDPTGEGDGDGDGGDDCIGMGENGATCTSNCECASGNCYDVPFVGGQCGECDSIEGDMDCADITGGGCTPPNPFMSDGSTCNMGEEGGGCQTSDVCMEGLTCSNVFDLFGVVQINTCGECASDADCSAPKVCAPLVDLMSFSGVNACIYPSTLPQDSYCNLWGSGNDACESGICSTVDVMDLAQVGACGECNSDADCDAGICTMGVFDFGSGTLTGSACQS